MLKRLVEYFSQSSIHGLHYIVDTKRHISERIFWAIVCSLSLLGTCVVLRGNIYNYENNAVSFVMETTYLNWNISFPAISVCEFESSDKLFDAGTRIYGENRNMNIDLYIREIAFYYGTCYTCSAHCGRSINCTEEFNSIVQQVRSRCKQLLKICQYNGVRFKCCQYFRLLQTEKGPCFTINSKHLPKLFLLVYRKKLTLDMTSNQKTGPGKLKFRATEKVKVILHSPEDVPFLNHPQQEKEVVSKGNAFNMKFTIKEIENDQYVKDVSISQRNCRFPAENYLKSYKIYSYSACVVDCRAQAQIQYCNCTHHFMPKIAGVDTCNLTGLICLSNVSGILGSLRTADYDVKKGLVCDCLPSCLEPEYNVVSKITTHILENNGAALADYSKITIELDSLPREQFKRKVVRSPLELVVSMGGTIGFFLGASLLSIAEFFYYFCVRRMVDKKRQHIPPYQNRLNQDIPEILLNNKKNQTN